jgi:hypothetical protein
MSTIDFVVPILGLCWGIVTYILLKQNKSKPERWSHIWGFGI